MVATHRVDVNMSITTEAFARGGEQGENNIFWELRDLKTFVINKHDEVTKSLADVTQQLERLTAVLLKEGVPQARVQHTYASEESSIPLPQMTELWKHAEDDFDKRFSGLQSSLEEKHAKLESKFLEYFDHINLFNETLEESVKNQISDCVQTALEQVFHSLSSEPSDEVNTGEKRRSTIEQQTAEHNDPFADDYLEQSVDYDCIPSLKAQQASTAEEHEVRSNGEEENQQWGEKEASTAEEHEMSSDCEEEDQQRIENQGEEVEGQQCMDAYMQWLTDYSSSTAAEEADKVREEEENIAKEERIDGEDERVELKIENGEDEIVEEKMTKEEEEEEEVAKDIFLLTQPGSESDSESEEIAKEEGSQRVEQQNAEDGSHIHMTENGQGFANFVSSYPEQLWLSAFPAEAVANEVHRAREEAARKQEENLMLLDKETHTYSLSDEVSPVDHPISAQSSIEETVTLTKTQNHASECIEDLSDILQATITAKIDVLTLVSLLESADSEDDADEVISGESFTMVDHSELVQEVSQAYVSTAGTDCTQRSKEVPDVGLTVGTGHAVISDNEMSKLFDHIKETSGSGSTGGSGGQILSSEPTLIELRPHAVDSRNINDGSPADEIPESGEVVEEVRTNGQEEKATSKLDEAESVEIIGTLLEADIEAGLTGERQKRFTAEETTAEPDPGGCKKPKETARSNAILFDFTQLDQVEFASCHGDSSEDQPAALDTEAPCEYAIVPMGHYCLTASFLKKFNLRCQAFPLDWSQATFKVWKHMLTDDFRTLLSEPEDGKCHPYNSAEEDVSMFIHQGGWATNAVRDRRVPRLRDALARGVAFGISFYLAGYANIGSPLLEVIKDACALLDMEAGFSHILLVWFTQKLSSGECHDHEWVCITDRLTVLNFSPRATVNWNGCIAEDDGACLHDLLRQRFPNVLGNYVAAKDTTQDDFLQIHSSSAGDGAQSSASSEADTREGVDLSFDDSPYWQEIARREHRSRLQSETKALECRPTSTPPMRGRMSAPVHWAKMPVSTTISFYLSSASKSGWEYLGRGADVTAMAFYGARFFFTTKADQLWGRDSLRNTQVGSHLIDWALNVVNMSCANGVLLVLLSHGQLWWRDTKLRPLIWPGDWSEFGTAPSSANAITTIRDRLYVAVPDQKILMSRKMGGPRNSWRFECNLPRDVMDIAAFGGGGQIMCLTKSGALYKWMHGTGDWIFVSNAPEGTFALSSRFGQIICATEVAAKTS